MTTALAAIDPADEQTVQGRWDYARTLANAGDLIPKGLWAARKRPDGVMLPPEPSPGKIMLVMETGRMLGMHPVAALNGINVIEGKATISPALMSAKVRNDGHRLRVFVEGRLEDGNLEAVAQLVRRDDPEFTYEARWNVARAIRAGLAQKYEQTPSGWVLTASKDNWRKYTEAMLKARAIGEVCREGAEDSLTGVQYTPEELGADTNEEGEVTTITATRDWATEIDEAPSVEVLARILADLTVSPEYTPDLYARLVARSGMLAGNVDEPDEPEDDPNTIDADVVEDDEPPAEDDEYAGPPCPVCGGAHDASVHDDEAAER